MKSHVNLIFSIIFGCLLYETLKYFGLPFWMIFLTVPIWGYAQLYFTNRYNFRQSLAPEPIPEKGYENRVAQLEHNRERLEQLGFAKFDEFYLRLSHDVIAYCYRHPDYPVEVCDYHFGQLACCDFISRFAGDYSLTTTNSRSAGAFPRPAKKMLQGFPTDSAERLFTKHLAAGKFLAAKGLTPESQCAESFRRKFMRDFRESGENLTGVLFPVTAVYRLAQNRHKNFQKPLEEQFLAKTLELT